MTIRWPLSLLVFVLAGSLTAQNTYDAKILDYAGLKYPCEGASAPVLKIQNVGTATMGTCVVETWKNGLMVNSFNWILAVPALTGQVRQPVLPVVPDVQPGDDLEFRIISVNEQPDQDATGNILQLDLDTEVKYADDGGLTVEVITGDVTGEVYWKIINSAGQTVGSGGPYSEANTTITVPVSLDASSCFQFESFDATRGGASDVQVRVLHGSDALIVATSADLIGLYTEGIRTGNGEGCTEPVVLELTTDDLGAQVSYEIVQRGSDAVVCSGAGFPNEVTTTETCCLFTGCFVLRVFDSGGDGISGGGYILRTQGDNQRIIDNRGNFTTGSVSAVIGNGGFCLPLGTDKLIFTSCDKMDWVNNQFIVAAENPAVSAQFGVTNTTSGYQFWFFDPNGTYGYAKFRSHATSDGFGTGATRACHARINNWSPNQIPANVMMNVKVRGRVAGNNLPWGPVCRFMIDPVRAACPFTKLMDIPGNTNYSCGVTRTWGGSSLSKVVAKAVDGATQYQFRWNNAELAAPVIRTTTTPVLQLNWNPALPNGTYQVQVRAFKNGVWCVTSLPWGDECNVTITGSTAMGLIGGNTTSTGDVKLAMFPNPNNGEQLTVSLSAVEEGVETISVDIFDLSGARVSSRTMAVNDGMVYQVLSLGEMADGLYMVNITAGTQRYTERLVIAK